MTSTKFNKLRLVCGLLAGTASLGAISAEAQVQPSATYREDAGSALTRHLRSLADNPRSLHALMGAATAALELGDPQAAITFFARAEEIAPRDPRIKAGFGSAFLQMEQPQSALKFFMDARSLGIAESSIAGDRGLAYDLLGDPKQAQQDYRLALRVKNDPEIERRLALSLAITGDKAGAMAAIHNQLQRQDRAAWRTRAFVLALTGDSAAATQAVRSVMPASAAAMQPFLTRLPTLDAAARAKAVHFGHMPMGAGTQLAQATPVAPVAAPPPAQAGQPDTRQPALGGRAAPPPAAGNAVPASSRTSVARADDRPQPRRQSGTPMRSPSPGHPTLGAAQPAERKPEPAPTRIAAATPREAQPDPEPSRAGPTQLTGSAAAPAAPNPSPPAIVPTPPEPQPMPTLNQAPSSTASAPPAPPPSPAAEPFGPPVPADVRAAPPPAAAPVETVARPEPRIEAPPPASAPAPQSQLAARTPEASPKPSAEAPARSDAPKPETNLAFADVIKAIEGLPTDAAATQPAQRPSITARKPAEPAPAEAAPAPKVEDVAAEPAGAAPTRHWVQIASAPDNLVDHEYRRLKRKHPSLLSDKEGYRTPMGQSNRVLVGPFDSEDAAKAFVGELKKDRLTAIAWTSSEGHGVDKISPR
jgi:Flp pilus assembly protein TadD